MVNLGLLYPTLLLSLAKLQGRQGNGEPCLFGEPCFIEVWGYLLDATSFPLYVISLSVFIQSFLFVTLGALADYGSLRKQFLIVLGSFASLLCISFGFVDSLFQASMLVILSNVCFGTSYVFYFAYIPVLSRFHPTVIRANDITEAEAAIRYEKTANQISSNGMAIGYSGAVLVLLILMGTFYLASSNELKL